MWNGRIVFLLDCKTCYTVEWTEIIVNDGSCLFVDKIEDKLRQADDCIGWRGTIPSQVLVVISGQEFWTRFCRIFIVIEMFPSPMALDWIF